MGGVAVVMAALLAATAAALLIGGAPTLARLGPSSLVSAQAAATPSGWRMFRLVLGGVGLVIVGVVAGPIAAGWCVVLGIVVGTTVWSVRRARADRAWRTRSDETARVVMGLAMLLRAGQIPSAALSEAAQDAPILAPVAAAARLGGDVAQAFREAAVSPGREGLGRVAAAWQVAERTGAPVATVLLQVAEALRAERELAGLVEAELAMARGSARVMAVLPFAALLLGTLVGADPVGFLMGHPLGLILAILGTGLAALGVVWTEKLAARS